jgi:hypothetical protein
VTGDVPTLTLNELNRRRRRSTEVDFRLAAYSRASLSLIPMSSFKAVIVVCREVYQGLTRCGPEQRRQAE